MLAILAAIGLQPKLAKVLISAALHWVIEVRRTPEGRSVLAIERLNV
jgi:hypothetical protein